MREEVTRQRLDLLMEQLAQEAPRRGRFRVYFVGDGTAVYAGWRNSSIDVDLYSDEEVVFRNIQEIKERLGMNIEFARPEDFVPPLKGSADRHLFITTVGRISFYHSVFIGDGTFSYNDWAGSSDPANFIVNVTNTTGFLSAVYPLGPPANGTIIDLYYSYRTDSALDALSQHPEFWMQVSLDDEALLPRHRMTRERH